MYMYMYIYMYIYIVGGKCLGCGRGSGVAVRGDVAGPGVERRQERRDGAGPRPGVRFRPL